MGNLEYLDIESRKACLVLDRRGGKVKLMVRGNGRPYLRWFSESRTRPSTEVPTEYVFRDKFNSYFMDSLIDSLTKPSPLLKVLGEKHRHISFRN